MSKQVFINFPVSDLEASTKFYEALGFTKNPMFSDENASSMMWSDDIAFMLLKSEYYQTFLKDKTVADTKTTSGALVALTLETREAVQEFGDIAKANGGDYYIADSNKDLDFMFGLEVSDPDGNILEPVWMNMDFNQ